MYDVTCDCPHCGRGIVATVAVNEKTGALGLYDVTAGPVGQSALPGADYLDRFPPEHRASADWAYQDGFADGANNAGEDGEESEPQSASPDPEGQSARLPWFVCVSPDYYDDPCDTGYNWEGEADDRDDAVRQALTQCHIDNDRPYVGMPDDERTEDMEGSKDQPVDPDDLSVTVHAAEPDFRAIGLAVHKGEPGALAMLARALRAVRKI